MAGSKDRYALTDYSTSSLLASLSSALLSEAELKSHRRATYLARYLSDLGAQAILIENEYVDRDYLDDYATYYVKCFKPYKRHCKRLHFFRRPLSDVDLHSLVRGDLSDEATTAIKASYLGFVVARPLPGAVVGRTVLATYPDDGGRRHYDVVRPYKVNLFGVAFEVRSLAFQEQDRVLAACATVALWCSLHQTAHLFGTPSPGPAIITRAANVITQGSRPIPSHGLTVQQICNAVSHVGLEPEVFQVHSDTPLVSLIYSHLTMGLPVLLTVEIEGVGHHAVTLAGYSLLPTRALEQEVAGSARSIPMTGLRINEFYVHDDQIGPFSRIEVKPATDIAGKSYPVTFVGQWMNRSTNKALVMYPRAVIVPVYHKIRVTFLDMLKWVTRLDSLLKLILQPDAAHEWNIKLTTSNDYKVSIAARGISGTVLEDLRFQGHPRFVWQVSLELGSTHVLDLLGDATDMARAFPIYQVIWSSTEFRNSLHSLLSAPKLAALTSEALTERFRELLLLS